MKNLGLVALFVTVMFTSCGEEGKKSEEWTVCKCHAEMDKLDEEMKTKGGSDELVEKMRGVMSNCDKIQDEMGMEKFMAEKENCK